MAYDIALRGDLITAPWLSLFAHARGSAGCVDLYIAADAPTPCRGYWRSPREMTADWAHAAW
jgi:hypothetical protein